MNENRPRLLAYVGLFSGIYISSLIGFGLLVRATKGEGSSFNSLAILISVVAATFVFGRRNHRVFSRREYVVMVLSAIGVDTLIQCAGIAFLPSPFEALAVFRAMAFVLLCHAVLFAVGFSKIAVRNYIPRSNEQA